MFVNENLSPGGLTKPMPQNEPLVSVITPFLNCERFIREAVESVLAQTYRRWELLLVNDGSSDASAEIALHYAKRYPGAISYLEHEHRENLGISASRNLALRHARGEYVAFLDADDVWLSCKLERQVSIAQAYPTTGMVYGSSEYWYSWTGAAEGARRDYIPEPGIDTDRAYEPPALAVLLYPLGDGTPPPPSDVLARRDVVERVGGFEEQFRGYFSLYEDQAFYAKMYFAAPVFISSECWDRYRVHGDSCMSVVKRAGAYRAVRHYFLNWLESYLRDHNVVDASIWAALDKARRSDRAGEEIIRSGGWILRVAGGAVAQLVYPPDADEPLRVNIGKPGRAIYDIQLNRPCYKVAGGGRYAVEFRARADGERSVSIGVAEAHQPWDGLGLYKRVELSPEYRDFRAEFVVTRDEANARIHLDMGDSPISIEVEGVKLVHLPDGEIVEPGVRSLGAAGGTPSPSVQNEGVRPAFGEVNFGTLRRLTPVSLNWGLDRGLPVDRYYIRRFLARHAGAIAGCVLEVGDNSYTREFGANQVTRSEVLHVIEGNPQATIVGDLSSAPHIPAASFDCIILTQTLQLIYDVRAAVSTVHRILKPGGVLLATIPGISQTYDQDWARNWYWNFTTVSARRLFEEAFSPGAVTVESFGNVLAAVSFLQGLAAEELTRKELDYRDSGYDVTIGVRATKAEEAP